MNYSHLVGAVERAGTSIELGDHPVSQLVEMDMVHTYEFTDEASIEAVSKSIGIDFANQKKVELYTFEDQSAAAQSRDRFGITNEAALSIKTDSQKANKFIWDSNAVKYQNVRTAGRGVSIEADITDLPQAITDGNIIWSSRFGVL
ncbi:hypothetical protein ACFQJD_08050 [Haloplanus sp. GCM10025708]|uniref:hypothetical protein n=1 Tax=Haloplanus sp. GCM10025708 TaxID=3252679 RepID=UPI00360AEE1A